MKKHNKLFIYNNMPVDLRIRNLSVQDNVIEVSENIPRIPFNLTVYGKSSSGKTNALLNLLKIYKKNGKHFYKNAIVFTNAKSGTLFELEKDEYLKAKFVNSIYDKQGDNIIRKLVKHQETIKDQDKVNKTNNLEDVLLIFDDFITSSEFDKRRGVFQELFAGARHSRISIIITSQSYTLVPSTLRRMAWYNMIFRISNKKEREQIFNECCEILNLDEKEFEKVYDECVKEDYSFMFLDATRVNGRYSKRFGV